MVKFHTSHTLRENSNLNKESKIIKTKLTGEMSNIDYTTGDKLILAKETITTSSVGLKDLAEKIVIDVENGREENPRLYESIYNTLVDPTLPEAIKVSSPLRGRIAFVERQEGGEVKFGTMQAKPSINLNLVTISGGFEYTREMLKYNQWFKIEELNEAFGEALNAKLNDMYLSPIINFNYQAKNAQTPVTSSSDILVQRRDTMEAALSKAAQLPKVAGSFTVLLAHSADQFVIERILGSQTIDGTTYNAIGGVTDVVFYDGWDGIIGDESFGYEGVTPGTVYLIRPKRENFRAWVQEDNVLEYGSKDVSRGIEDQIVSHTTLAVLASPEDNVIKITLP